MLPVSACRAPSPGFRPPPLSLCPCFSLSPPLFLSTFPSALIHSLTSHPWGGTAGPELPQAETAASISGRASTGAVHTLSTQEVQGHLPDPSRPPPGATCSPQGEGHVPLPAGRRRPPRAVVSRMRRSRPAMVGPFRGQPSVPPRQASGARSARPGWRAAGARPAYRGSWSPRLRGRGFRDGGWLWGPGRPASAAPGRSRSSSFSSGAVTRGLACARSICSENRHAVVWFSDIHS